MREMFKNERTLDYKPEIKVDILWMSKIFKERHLQFWQC